MAAEMRSEDELAFLFSLVQHDLPDELSESLSSKPLSNADIHYFNEDGFTTLHLAVLQDSAECVNVLLNFGMAQLPAKKCGKYPLHFAQSEKVAAMLLEYGANAFLADFHGVTPTVEAMRNYKQGVIDAIVLFTINDSISDAEPDGSDHEHF